MTGSVSQGALNASNERPGSGFSGYIALLLMLLALASAVWPLTGLISRGGDARPADFVGLISAITVFTLLSAGFYMIQPNQGVSLTLFGSYRVPTVVRACAGFGRGLARLKSRCGRTT